MAINLKSLLCMNFAYLLENILTYKECVNVLLNFTKFVMCKTILSTANDLIQKLYIFAYQILKCYKCQQIIFKLIHMRKSIMFKKYNFSMNINELKYKQIQICYINIFDQIKFTGLTFVYLNGYRNILELISH